MNLNCKNQVRNGLLILSGFYFLSCERKSDKNNTTTNPSANKAPALRADVYVVKPAPLYAFIEAPGSLIPFEETEIRPEVSGRLVGLYLKEGDHINKGSLLAKIFDGDLQVQLKKLKIQLKIAQKTVARQQELLTISGISQQEVDLSALQVSNLKADIDMVGVNIRRTQIRAPFSGTVGLKSISTGAYITPATVITTLRQLKPIKLAFTVPEIYSSSIKPGQKIKFTIANNPTVYVATVTATETAMEESTRSLSVRALVGSSDSKLVSGSFAKVRIGLTERPQAIMIPTQAIVPQGRKKQVFVLKDGKVTPFDIRTGARDSAKVEVLSGLSHGDSIIISGLLFVKPGSEVIAAKIY